ncbi:long-chain fatty acid--CoA ligase [Nostocales cyanobacterium HT-58-2]|nr:long-chain fatty acid--CoA ligase [Nostocales cyanobacterium HT-58-2]
MLWSNKTYRAPPNCGEVLLGRTLPSLLDEACVSVDPKKSLSRNFLHSELRERFPLQKGLLSAVGRSRSDRQALSPSRKVDVSKKTHQARSPNPHLLNQWTETGWQTLSNEEFQSAVEEMALGLLDLQLPSDRYAGSVADSWLNQSDTAHRAKFPDCVALLMHSDVNFCIADMGCLLAGLINVPIDLNQTLEHIIFILRHTQAKVLIVSNLDLLYQVVPYLSETPKLKVVIVAEVPSDWQQIQSQILTSQLSGGENDQSLDISKSIQVFSLCEIRDRGRAEISESRKQQLRSTLSANDLATIIYIPGATGEPLGVMLTHENLSANALAMFTGIPDLEFGAKEVILSYLPLTHVFARVMLYGHINYGHSIYFTTPKWVIKHLKEVQPTIFATVPLLLEKVYNKILEQGSKQAKPATVREVKYNVLSRIRAIATQMMRKGEQTQKFRLSSLHLGIRLSAFEWKFPPLRISVSASQLREIAFTQRIYNWALNLAKEYELGQPQRGTYALMLKLADRLVFWQWRSVFGGRLKYLISGGAGLKAEITNLFAAGGVTILQGYGLTETSSALTYNRGPFNRAGTVGVPLAGVEIAIAEDGEILTKSPYSTQGYYKNPDATQQLIDTDGWLHTGDLGEFTEEGFLKITGLKKSRFKLSTGKYVTPQPLENKLEQSHLVTKAVAVGAERKFCAMLIFPNLDNLHSYALNLGIDLPTEVLLKHPYIIAMYQTLVDQANCHLPHWSTVKRFKLIHATLTVENGLLTPTHQVNRAKVTEVFAQEINAIYEDAGRRRKDTDDEKDMPLFSCPPIPKASCPPFAQSLITS